MPQVADYAKSPLLVIWEVTRACGLSCRHCRAEALTEPEPGELSTQEGLALVDQVADLGAPILVFSGGDPLRRSDLETFIRHAKSRALRAGTIPAATPLLTHERIRSLAHAGLDQLAFSLDASTPELHDHFRGVEGAFARTLNAAGFARGIGLPLQINSCLTRSRLGDFDRLAALVSGLGVAFWEIFFLVPVGRAGLSDALTAEEHERMFEKISAVASHVPFVVKVTEAQHYRRYLIERSQAARLEPGAASETGRPLFANAARVVNAGDGFCFVSNLGEVYPSGFLPLSGGSVRREGLVSAYRDSSLFQGLRDRSLLQGRCGACEYRQVCGGSRSFAYATTGDIHGEVSSCAHVPREHQAQAGGTDFAAGGMVTPYDALWALLAAASAWKIPRAGTQPKA